MKNLIETTQYGTVDMFAYRVRDLAEAFAEGYANAKRTKVALEDVLEGFRLAGWMQEAGQDRFLEMLAVCADVLRPLTHAEAVFVSATGEALRQGLLQFCFECGWVQKPRYVVQKGRLIKRGAKKGTYQETRTAIDIKCKCGRETVVFGPLQRERMRRAELMITPDMFLNEVTADGKVTMKGLAHFGGHIAQQAVAYLYADARLAARYGEKERVTRFVRNAIVRAGRDSAQDKSDRIERNPFVDPWAVAADLRARTCASCNHVNANRLRPERTNKARTKTITAVACERCNSTEAQPQKPVRAQAFGGRFYSSQGWTQKDGDDPLFGAHHDGMRVGVVRWNGPALGNGAENLTLADLNGMICDLAPGLKLGEHLTDEEKAAWGAWLLEKMAA